MTLTELQSEVKLITKRPDLSTETLLAVRRATLAAHHSDYFYKDIYETPIQFKTPAYRHDINYRTSFPLYRSVKYLRKITATGPAGSFLTCIQPESVVDSYYTNQLDVFYTVGDYIKVLSSTELEYILFGCYLHPDVTEGGYNSWIATEHPYAIVFTAAEMIFKMIGKTEEFAAYKMLRDEEFKQLAMSNLQGVGY